MKKNTWHIVFIVALILSLFASSSLNSSNSATLSTYVSDFLQDLFTLELTSEQEEKFHYLLRKTAHFSVFFLLGLGLSSIFHQKSKGYFIVFSTSLFIATVDELHQYIGGTRNGSINDVLLDCSGAIVGIISHITLYRFINSIKSRKNQKKT